jgi:predicted permease
MNMISFWRKLNGWRRRSNLDSDLAEEMRMHLEMKAVDTGDKDAARRQFGNATRLLEDSRAIWGWPAIEAWLRDFRFALRGLARRPGFTTTVVLTLALGIGTSSTIFSLVDTVLIRALPYPDADRLVALQEASPGDATNLTPVSPARLEDWQKQAVSFEGIAGSFTDTMADTTGTVPERLSGASVSPRFFPVVGTPPLLGRVFTQEDDRTGGPLVVVISEGLWRRRFGTSPSVLGQRLILNEKSRLIVGVMPETFQIPNARIEVWIPTQAATALMRVREARFYNSIARLKRGITVQQAQADLFSVQQKLGMVYPKTDAGWGAMVEPLKDRVIGRNRLALWLLVGSVGLLLLIACANVACLLLARLNSRGAEIATRCSLGAGRGAIARQLLTEGIAYAMLGGLVGSAGALAGVDYLRKQLPDVPRIAELTVDGRTLALVVAISVLAAILFSLAPILQTFRRQLSGPLRQGARSIGGSQRLPRILVTAQLALATALVIGAGLFLQSLMKLYEVPLGFHPENVLTLRVGASFTERPEAAIQRHERALAALTALPGVQAVGMSAGMPAVNSTWPREFEIVGQPSPDGSVQFARWRMVTAGYFTALGMPIVEGRTCRMDLGTDRPFEAVVSRGFADRHLRGQTAIGHLIQKGPIGEKPIEIVGIVADAREDGPNTEPLPMIYGCGYLRFWPDSDFLVQTRTPEALANAARQALLAVDPTRPIYGVRPMAEALHAALLQTRVRTQLVSLFSIMALSLAAIGLYGLMAYTVTQRTKEIGVRIALGARPVQIVGSILRSGGILAATGAVVGVAIAAAGARMMSTLLYGIQPSDIRTYLLSLVVLIAVALLACLIPSRRATSIDPTEALREQ